MGIINPRPAMRKGEERRIREALAKHARFYAEYVAQGMDKDAASKKAADDVRAGRKQ